MKKWHDAEKITDKEKEFNTETLEYEILMQQIPNFDKREEGRIKVYKKKEYSVYRVKNGFIVHNTNKKFEDGHTHLKSWNMAKTIIDNVLKKKRPKTNDLYILRSHIRISDDNEYKEYIEELIEAVKERGDNKYRNKNINSKRR